MYRKDLINCVIVVAFTIGILLVFSAYLTTEQKLKTKPGLPAAGIKTDEIIDELDYADLKINPPTVLNYLTKKEIYNLRKAYVKESIFASNNYEPKGAVFSQIADKKPWWNINACIKAQSDSDKIKKIEGRAKVSTIINNPNLIVNIIMAFSPWLDETNAEFCSSIYSVLLPDSLEYRKIDNNFIVTYSIPKSYLNLRANLDGNSTPYQLQLSGANALDFNYKYVFAANTNNIQMAFPSNPTIKDDVQIFNDFIHLGTSCKIEGGCNNLSPLQPDKVFSITDFPAEISLKLWKEKPSTVSQNADLIYKIIFKAK